jgi:hypothetical protein
MTGSSFAPTIALLIAGLLIPTAIGAADDSGAGTLGIVFENDLFANEDRHYTTGVQVSWHPGADRTPGWAMRVARLLPRFSAGGAVHAGYALGQNIYTPSDIALKNPPLDDRPYAGWLYGAVGLGVETGRQYDQIALTLGVVGPTSLAGETQIEAHDISNASRPLGWDTQLGNEPGIVLTWQRSWRLPVALAPDGFEAELSPHAGGALGNVFTYANAGMTVRFGGNLPLDYGPPRIQPGIQGSVHFVPRSGFGWYLFGGLEGRAMARNIFLDGNTFRDSRSVDKEPLVGDLQFGIVLAWRKARLSYTHVLRSREYETQQGDDNFGSVSLSVPF